MSGHKPPLKKSTTLTKLPDYLFNSIFRQILYDEATRPPFLKPEEIRQCSHTLFKTPYGNCLLRNEKNINEVVFIRVKSSVRRFRTIQELRTFLVGVLRGEEW